MRYASQARAKLPILVTAAVMASLALAGCGGSAAPEKNTTPPSGSSSSSANYMKKQNGAK